MKLSPPHGKLSLVTDIVICYEIREGSRAVATTAIGIAQVIDRLAEVSKRPRYALMVLTLLAEQASENGRVGPSIDAGDQRLVLRDWVSLRLSRMAENAGRRHKVEQRVRAELSAELPEDLLEASALVERKVDEHIRASGADNFSRVVGELEAAGYLKRFYEGRITKHENRGGRRTLVLVLNQEILAAFRRRSILI